MKQLKFEVEKIHKRAILPEKIAGNLAFDLHVVADDHFYTYNYPGQDNSYRYKLYPGVRRLFHTGLKIAIPTGFGVIFWDRSGMSAKRGIQKFAGCIDSTYRGEWLVSLKNTDDSVYEIIEGDRIIQAIVVPEYTIDFELVDKLDATERGEGGFGASGR